MCSQFALVVVFITITVVQSQDAELKKNKRGVFVGNVIDQFGKSLPHARISCLEVGEGDDTKTVTVKASADGKFRIARLKVQATYRLSAKVSRDGQEFVGISYASTPNTHVIIRASRRLNDEPDTTPAKGLESRITELETESHRLLKYINALENALKAIDPKLVDQHRKRDEE